MIKENSQKVAIVGAGTIGLYLSWKLSEAGHDITVFEENQKIERKVCSGLISERLKNFIPIDDSFIEHQVESCLIHFSQKTINLDFKLKFLVISRQRLNEKLYELAKKAGAKVLFGRKINEILEGFDKIIGCDGALSKIRENLSLPQPRMQLGIQTFLPQPNSSKYVETWPTKNGFFWKVPHGSQTEYGLIGSLNSAKEDFEKFYEAQKINLYHNKPESALIPQGLVLPENRNITLCGDAAGLTKPWSGGGIIWGLTAANILIKNFPDFHKYCRDTKRFFKPKIFFGNFSNNLIHFLGENLPLFLPKKVSVDNDFLLE